jgi:ATP-dependent DNA helicase DinG
MEISLPDASLKLIQACGRLIRTETDTGKITI